MASTKSKTKTKSTKYSKPKTSIFLCCFGSPMPEIKESDPIPKVKRSTSLFSWPRIRFKTNMVKSTSKTMPFEASFSDKAHLYPQSRSKSTLHHKFPPPTPPPAPVVPSATPYSSPTQTRHGATNNVEEDTRVQGTATPTRAKRQARRLSSSVENQTTLKKSKTAGRSYDALVGMSVLGVTLVIMMFWGRVCAILCTSAWLYFIPRFKKSGTVNDDDDPDTRSISISNEVDLDSEVYKKKVIMEGLLGRNHRGG